MFLFRYICCPWVKSTNVINCLLYHLILHHFLSSCSNAILATDNRFAKTAAKPMGAAPPATPLEKYKLRIAVGKRTGRMDLACKSVWHTADDSASNNNNNNYSNTRHHQTSNSSVAPSPKSRPSAGDLEASAEASASEMIVNEGGGGADGAQEETGGVFLTQEGEEVQFKTTEELVAAEGEKE